MKELFTALSKFQSEVKNPDKSSKGVHNANYAPIEAVWDVARLLLGKYGLSVSHFPISKIEDGKYLVGLKSYLCHSSGEFISNDYYLPVQNTEAQKVGATLTYLKRQSVTAILGITPSNEDLDADDVDTQATKKAHAIVQSSPKPAITKPVQQAQDLATNAQVSLIKKLGGTVSANLTKKDASEIIGKLQNKPSISEDEIPF